jgi:FkbH-like protein
MSGAARPGSVDLYWLPPPDDWEGAIKRIEALDAGQPAAAWDALAALAGTRLNFLRTARLDHALTRIFGAAPPEGLASRPVRLAVLGSSTVDHLLPAIRVAGLRRGLWITTYAANYGQYRQELLDPASPLHDFRPDAVLFALDAPHLLRRADAALDEAGADQALDETLDELRSLWNAARTAFRCQIIQQTALPVFANLLGLNEHRLPGSAGAMTARLNAALRQSGDEGVSLLSLDARAAQDGLDSWHDPKLWLRAKQEVSPAAAPLYGDLVGRLAAAAQGRAAKCLVLDLDNTLWGGVIGDDGLEGIELGQGSALGEAFSAFQSYAAGLAKRGVILATCSKNDEANAIAAFERHPEMVLRRADMSAFVANWNDKASNLREIARRLNIGLDALVFVDDNPFERNLVRRELPMVAVPEVPDDPALFARCISDAGYFEGLGVTAEDRERTRLYRANTERDALLAAATDMGSYLRSLDMTLLWRRFDRSGLKRVTQLINKTNQFNLTTRRYAEDEVAAVISDDRAVGLQFRLVDRFGDNGVIAVVIGRMTGDTLDLDSWLMSCRVLGREVERATLATVVGEARRMGARRLLGRYRPTAKNAMVAEHYSRLGFRPLDGDGGASGEALYALDLTDPCDADLPMAIEEEAHDRERDPAPADGDFP